MLHIKMNLAVSFYVNPSSSKVTPFNQRTGPHKYFFDKNFDAVDTFDESNNLYLSIKSYTLRDEVKVGVRYSKKEFGDFEYFFRNFDGVVTIENSFCNEENCNKKGYLRDYLLINGYTLKFSKNLDNALFFKLKLIKNAEGVSQKCYTTLVDGKEFILTYHPKYKKLVLNDNLIENNSLFSPNNILFVTDNDVLYENLSMLDLPAYENIKLLSDF